MGSKLGTVVIVSGHEGHAQLDRTMIKGLGVEEMFIFPTGREAARFIDCNYVDLVLCDWELEDMRGLDFVRAVKQDGSNFSLPVIMASYRNSEPDVLDAVSAGCVGYLVRPYSLNALLRQVNMARRSSLLPGSVSLMLAKAKARRQEGEVAEAGREVERAVKGCPAREFFDQGSTLLLERKYDRAIEAFNSALRINRAYAEAFEGLANAWKGKGDHARYLRYLKRASWAYAEQERFMEVRSVFVEILKSGEHPSNPFYELGKRMWKNRDYKEAVISWRRAVKLTPQDERVVNCLARAYMVLGDEGRAEALLLESLERNPRMEAARELLARISPPRSPQAQAITSWYAKILDHLRGALSFLHPGRTSA